MPIGQMDALGAFSHLSDNVPLWMTRLSELKAHTTAKHAEYAEEFRKHSHTTVRPRRRKNSSVCSIRTEDLKNLAQSTAPETTDEIPRNQTNPRKRGTDQAPSIDSGERHTLVSTRHNLIIHYDGHTQKSLEEMVRNVGTARNNIRRGKMSAIPLGGFRTGMYSRSARMSNPSSTSLQSEDASPDQLLSNIRSARNRGPPPPAKQAPQTPPKDSAFDLADKHLELTHSLCETAAYHFLRMGDCASELNSVEEKLKVLLDLANREVQRLKAERQEEPEDEDDETTIEAEPTKKPEPDNRPPTTSHDGAIEVDDDAESVESLDLTAFRANRRRAYG